MLEQLRHLCYYEKLDRRVSNSVYKIIKYIFDIVSALLLYLLISPLFLVIICIAKVQIGSPIFFKQTRSGLKQKPFTILKFRTMTDKRDENGNILPDEQRQTNFGGWLRSTSLDELPQLLNIIKGEMSVIGPRPLPTEYDEYYYRSELPRFNVRGGLIQPEVLHDVILPTWDEQLAWESDYAKKVTFKNDLKILVAVFKTLFKRNSTDYGHIVRKTLVQERMNMKGDEQ